jgi:hypothetical protein
MAALLATQIRKAAAAVLTDLATTAARVYVSRVYPIQDAELPALRIYTRDEDIETSSMGVGRVRQHQLELVVEACVKSNTDFDDTADQIRKEVQNALDADPGLGGLCKYVEPRAVQDAFEGEGEKVVAVKRMTFEVLYFAAQGAPDVPL